MGQTFPDAQRALWHPQPTRWGLHSASQIDAPHLSYPDAWGQRHLRVWPKTRFRKQLVTLGFRGGTSSRACDLALSLDLHPSLLWKHSMFCYIIHWSLLTLKRTEHCCYIELVCPCLMSKATLCGNSVLHDAQTLNTVVTCVALCSKKKRFAPTVDILLSWVSCQAVFINTRGHTTNSIILFLLRMEDRWGVVWYQSTVPKLACNTASNGPYVTLGQVVSVLSGQIDTLYNLPQYTFAMQ